MPRQKLPAAYIHNGAVDVVRPEVILNKHSMTGDMIGALLMDNHESVGIDSALDWRARRNFNGPQECRRSRDPIILSSGASIPQALATLRQGRKAES